MNSVFDEPASVPDENRMDRWEGESKLSVNPDGVDEDTNKDKQIENPENIVV